MNIIGFLLYLVVINALAYYKMHEDKQRARRKEWRISENTLLGIAIIGGTLGIWFGMKAPLYHKAAKSLFRVGVPLIAAAQVMLLLGLYITCVAMV